MSNDLLQQAVDSQDLPALIDEVLNREQAAAEASLQMALDLHAPVESCIWFETLKESDVAAATVEWAANHPGLADSKEACATLEHQIQEAGLDSAALQAIQTDLEQTRSLISELEQELSALEADA